MLKSKTPLNESSQDAFPSNIPVGISSCLMGEKVRYDGGHMRSKICTEQLDNYFKWIPTCPEIAIGMPSPRPAIHIAIRDEQERLLDSNSHQHDYTDQIIAFSHKRMQGLEHLSGYVVAKGSPSCGMERIKVFKDEGDKKWHSAHKNGVGMFTKVLMETYPNLPVEEDGRLNDGHIRDNFILRVFAYNQWQEMHRSGLSYHKLFQFHARIKYNLMASSVPTYKELGRKLADASQDKSVDIEQFAQEYIGQAMSALKKIVKRKAHRNVLLHLMGYFKKELSSVEKQNFRQSIDDYFEGITPLGVPLHLLRLYLARFPNEYLSKQFYIFPYPSKLATREFL